MNILVGPIAPCATECPMNGSGNCTLACTYTYRPRG